MRKNIHFRRIPDYIEQELRNIQEQHVIVAAIINIKKSDIARGAYRHLGNCSVKYVLHTSIDVHTFTTPSALS